MKRRDGTKSRAAARSFCGRTAPPRRSRSPCSCRCGPGRTRAGTAAAGPRSWAGRTGPWSGPRRAGRGGPAGRGPTRSAGPAAGGAKGFAAPTRAPVAKPRAVDLRDQLDNAPVTRRKSNRPSATWPANPWKSSSRRILSRSIAAFSARRTAAYKPRSDLRSYGPSTVTTIKVKGLSGFRRETPLQIPGMSGDFF